MKLKYRGALTIVTALLVFILSISVASLEGARDANSPKRGSLWAHDNLFAWCVVPFDAKNRGPQERAQMLEKVGFKHFAYDWREKDIPTFDEEIDALQKHGIDLTCLVVSFRCKRSGCQSDAGDL